MQTAAPRLHQTAVPRFRPLQELLAACVHFSCSQSPISTAPRFGCSSPIASDSTAAPRLRPLQLQLSVCVRFDCCSPIASACSLTCSGRFQPMPNVVELSSFVRHQSSPAPRTSHFCHSHTHTHTHTHAHTRTHTHTHAHTRTHAHTHTHTHTRYYTPGSGKITPRK